MAMPVVGSRSKKKYTMEVGDNGRTFTDEEGNQHTENEFREKEDDYTTDRGNQNADANRTQSNRKGELTPGGKLIAAPSDVKRSAAGLGDLEKKKTEPTPKPVSNNIMNLIGTPAEEKKKKRNAFA